MRQPNEQGQLQHDKVRLRVTMRFWFQEIILHIKNWDAERWYQKYGK